MTSAARPGARIALAIAAVLIAALAFWQWTARPRPPLPVRPPSPSPTGTPERSAAAAPRSAAPSSAQRAASAPDATAPRPRPSVFDFAKMTPPARTSSPMEAERFPTKPWFTEEDLRHPERYFALAERMPELNRPEERHDTLEFFLAYRKKLAHDLERAGDTDQRQEIMATIDRYDAAIARLRALIDPQRPE